jgi:putative transposase
VGDHDARGRGRGSPEGPGPWRHLEAVEFATLAWVDQFNTRRLLEPIGYVPLAEYEVRDYQQPAVA